MSTTAVDQNFPHHALQGCDSALVMFCAAFGGNQDARWVRDAGLTATCIDLDQPKLHAMANSYPKDWRFLCGDVYEFPASTTDMWDVVTLDPFTNQFDRCAGMIDDWCRLARHAVVIGTGAETIVEAPDGWEVTGTYQRSTYDGGVYWTLVERA